MYHDNNRDINIALVQMRALTDWYFTAHPPIMHDLHESMSLLYTYSGGPPQNPNLDPLLFAELPWFSNWELAQMTKWGMPGVYTHAFMDGWSPGYLGSVAYNHNGLMKMYETQSGRDPASPARGAGGDERRRAAVRAEALPARLPVKPEPVRQQRRPDAAQLGRGRAGSGCGGSDGRGCQRRWRRPRAGVPEAAGRTPAAQAAGARGGNPARRAAASGGAGRRRARCRASGTGRERRIASGTAAFRCRRTPPPRSAGATTRTTWRPAFSRRCS